MWVLHGVYDGVSEARADDQMTPIDPLTECTDLFTWNLSGHTVYDHFGGPTPTRATGFEARHRTAAETAAHYTCTLHTERSYLLATNIILKPWFVLHLDFQRA